MGTIQAIFQQLGVDSSFVYQFTITVIVFILAKIIFFNRLQKILDLRVEKTTKLEKNTDKQFEEIKKFTENYTSKINEATKNSLQKINESKLKITKSFDEDYKKNENEINNFIALEVEKASQEISSKKEILKKEVEALADQLVAKVSKVIVLSFLLLSSGAYAEGHHPGPESLISGFVNLGILVAFLIYKLRKPLQAYLSKRSSDIASVIQRAEMRSKESAMILESQKKKMDSLHSEIEDIEKNTKEEIEKFNLSYSKETFEKIERLKNEAHKKIENEKTIMVNKLNQEIINDVISKSKSIIEKDETLNSKISQNLLKGLN